MHGLRDVFMLLGSLSRALGGLSGLGRKVSPVGISPALKASGPHLVVPVRCSFPFTRLAWRQLMFDRGMSALRHLCADARLCRRGGGHLTHSVDDFDGECRGTQQLARTVSD